MQSEVNELNQLRTRHAADAPLLVDPLLDEAKFEHPCKRIQLIETHISWVILTGEYAYKIKKPVDLGFLDFSRLEQRRFFCNEELRLNRRLAPDYYLDVVPITGAPNDPCIGGRDRIIDYAVKMREFPQDAQMNRAIKEGKVKAEQVDNLVDLVARFHERIDRAPAASRFGTPVAVHDPVTQNFRQVSALVEDADVRKRLDSLQKWSDQIHNSLEGAISQRKHAGHVRECHGDLHLGNIALVNGELVIFDGIEFSEDLRWIDTISEIALLSIDLQHHHRPDYAHRFLNGYLETTGDYDGLALLPYYQAYRAMVRAKVAQIRLGQNNVSVEEADALTRAFAQYLAQAHSYTAPPNPLLIITRGLSGSGKTTVSQGLVEVRGAVRVRSDVERKRLFSIASQNKADLGMNQGMYDVESTQRTYAYLEERAEAILRAGYSVIVDATFLNREHRDSFRQLASSLNVSVRILDVCAEAHILRERIARRAQAGNDASDANLAVLENQLRAYRPLDPDERCDAISVDGGAGLDLELVAAQLSS